MMRLNLLAPEVYVRNKWIFGCLTWLADGNLKMQRRPRRDLRKIGQHVWYPKPSDFDEQGRVKLP